MFLHLAAFANVSGEGKYLLNRFWKDMKEGDTHNIAKYMDKEFQAVHSYGAQDKSGELQIIKNLHMTKYTLSNIVETERESLLIQTYEADVQRTIDGQTVTTTAPRMTIWKHVDGHWKLVAHANLTPPAT